MMNTLVPAPLDTTKCFSGEMSEPEGTSFSQLDGCRQSATLEGCDHLHSREGWFLTDWFPRETQHPPCGRVRGEAARPLEHVF